MEEKKYQLHLKGYVGGEDFDADYVDYILSKNEGRKVNVLIDSLGGQSNTALSIYSAFHRHGHVNVHFVGMNASAATIASLGARRITMDRSAMYLVHKCSVAFFEWGNMNADDLQSLIANIEKAKADLDKMDANIAQMYATRCKKEPSELLNLMKEGGWLTSLEALDWGFVDEVTDYATDTAPVIDSPTIEALAAAGIPIPENMEPGMNGHDAGFVRRIVDGLVSGMRQVFGGSVAQLSPTAAPVPTEDRTDLPSYDMKKNFTTVNAVLKVEGIDSQDDNVVLSMDQMQAIEDELTERQNRITSLENERTRLEDANNALQATLDKVPDGAVTVKHEGKEQDEYADIRIDPVNFMDM